MLSGNKVLLIDDEAGKGWGEFYEYLLSKCGGVSFSSLPITAKDNRKDVLGKAVSEIEKINPDVILLDLRLVEMDIYERKAEKLTGYKLIEEIKTINRGIQILITTASNKTETYREVIKEGADDFIIKVSDSPNVLESLIKKIEKCSEESSFLKPFYSQLAEIKNLLDENFLEKVITHQSDDDLNYEYLYDDIFYYLEMASQIVWNRNVEERFSYTVLYLYNILETLSSYYIEYNGRDGIEEFKDEREIKRFDHRNSYAEGRYSGGHLSDAQKIYNVYYYHKYSAEPNLFENIFNLFNYRNNYVHHTDPEEMDQLEDLFVEDFVQFKQKFYGHYSTVFSFLRMLAN